MTGTIIQFCWILGKATAQIGGDDGREYVFLCDGEKRLCAGDRVKFTAKTTPRAQDLSVPEVIGLEVLKFENNAAQNAAHGEKT